MGKECELLVVVGDQKTYEHMQNVIRTMPDKYAWVRPYPGMWQNHPRSTDRGSTDLTIKVRVWISETAS